MIDANTRGEVAIELEGERFVMRPSYEAIEAIEGQTGKSMLALARAAETGDLLKSDAAIVVTECIRAWGKQQRAAGASDAVVNGAVGANAGKIGRLIYTSANGYYGANQLVYIVMLGALTGGVTEAGEWKPATMKATADAG